MSEEYMEEMIQKELDHELSVQEQQKLERTLSERPDIRRMRAEYQQMEKWLRQLPLQKPFVSITDQVLAKIDSEKPKTVPLTAKRWWGWKMGLGLTAALLLSWGGYQWSQTLLRNDGVSPKRTQISQSRPKSTHDFESQTKTAVPSMLLGSSSQVVWSPDRKWRAQPEGKQVVILSAAGKKVYHQQLPPETGLLQLHWLSKAVLAVDYQQKDKQQKRLLIQRQQETFKMKEEDSS